jgi:hypothetical protein
MWNIMQWELGPGGEAMSLCACEVVVAPEQDVCRLGSPRRQSRAGPLVNLHGARQIWRGPPLIFRGGGKDDGDNKLRWPRHVLRANHVLDTSTPGGGSSNCDSHPNNATR